MLFYIFAKYSIALTIFYSSSSIDKLPTNYDHQLDVPQLFSTMAINFPRHPGHHRGPRKRWLLLGSFTLPASLVSHGSGTVNGTREAYKRDRKTTVPFSCLLATISLLYIQHFPLESCTSTLQGETELCVTSLSFKFSCSVSRKEE